jgi:hypothetical protein
VSYYVQDPLPGMEIGRLEILNGLTCPWCPEFLAEEGICRCLADLDQAARE